MYSALYWWILLRTMLRLLAMFCFQIWLILLHKNHFCPFKDVSLFWKGIKTLPSFGLLNQGTAGSQLISDLTARWLGDKPGELNSCPSSCYAHGSGTTLLFHLIQSSSLPSPLLSSGEEHWLWLPPEQDVIMERPPSYPWACCLAGQVGELARPRRHPVGKSASVPQTWT